MLDALFIGAIVVFGLLSFGLIVLCEQLKGGGQ
jgi:hypothetical protein